MVDQKLGRKSIAFQRAKVMFICKGYATEGRKKSTRRDKKHDPIAEDSRLKRRLKNIEDLSKQNQD